MGSADTDRMYMCIDLKSFYASVECADLGVDPFTTPLVVADNSRGKGAITLAISPALKKLGVFLYKFVYGVMSIKYSSIEYT